MPDPDLIYILVWRDESQDIQAQAYATREGAQRDLTDHIFDPVWIVESTVQA